MRKFVEKEIHACDMPGCNKEAEEFLGRCAICDQEACRKHLVNFEVFLPDYTAFIGVCLTDLATIQALRLVEEAKKRASALPSRLSLSRRTLNI